MDSGLACFSATIFKQFSKTYTLLFSKFPFFSEPAKSIIVNFEQKYSRFFDDFFSFFAFFSMVSYKIVWDFEELQLNFLLFPISINFSISLIFFIVNS